jgi:transposase
MSRLSKEAKEAIVKKAFSENGKKRLEIAKNYNIGFSTLEKWIRRAKDSGIISCKNTESNKSLSALERLEHLQASYKLNDIEVGAYCRKQGIYSHQLQQWKTEFMSTNTESKNQNQALELKKLRLENRQLKQDLFRKDKALSETAALLILKKKAAQIWGDVEDV